MNLSFWFARRYFYSKKSRNVINVIAFISQIGITICAAALIIVLSVYNGLEKLMIDLYNTFDSDLKISLVEGKYFEPDSLKMIKLSEIEGVVSFTKVIEENVLIEYDDLNNIARIKAIDPNYVMSMELDSLIVYGDPILYQDSINYAVLGVGVASKLDMGYFDYSKTLRMYFPKNTKSKIHINPEDAFYIKHILPGGVFAIQEEYDNKYVLVPFDFMEGLVKSGGKITAFEMNFIEDIQLDKVKSKAQEILGPQFKIMDRDEQHASFYKITRLEKYMTFIILSFIIIIAAFNLIGSLLMLSLEKKKDMMVLQSMGAHGKMICNVFFYEGILLSFSSAIIGSIIGVTLVVLQMKFGFIKLGNSDSTFIVDSYPIALKFSDLILVFFSVTIIGLFSSYIPARSSTRNLTIKDLHK